MEYSPGQFGPVLHSAAAGIYGKIFFLDFTHIFWKIQVILGCRCNYMVDFEGPTLAIFSYFSKL